jgi:hypothetical protein
LQGFTLSLAVLFQKYTGSAVGWVYVNILNLLGVRGWSAFLDAGSLFSLFFIFSAVSCNKDLGGFFNGNRRVEPVGSKKKTRLET